MQAADDPSQIRVHISGLAGSGKTTLARWIGDTFDVPVHDLDWIAYDQHGARPSDEADRLARDNRKPRVRNGRRVPWIKPMLERATAIAWLDVPLRVCLYRMLTRHVMAELARTNQHPGWMRLFRFMNYTRRSAKAQRHRACQILALCGDVTTRCRTSSDVSTFKQALVRR